MFREQVTTHGQKRKVLESYLHRISLKLQSIQSFCSQLVQQVCLWSDGQDNTHQKHAHNIHPVVKFTKEAEFSGKKGEFLSRDSHKQGFINLISDGLRKRGCSVINISGDIDFGKDAVESPHFHSTTWIEKDTDLFILLLYHAYTEYKHLYFHSDTNVKAIKIYNNRLKVILAMTCVNNCFSFMPLQIVMQSPGFLGVCKKATFQKLVRGDPILQSCSSCENQTRAKILAAKQRLSC